jgi:hypothetical protein
MTAASFVLSCAHAMNMPELLPPFQLQQNDKK